MQINLNEIFTEAFSGLLPMATQLINICMPYIFIILLVTIPLPIGLNLLETWLFGKSTTKFDLYKEQEESFGGHFVYDDDGELDAIAYGDFDNSEYDDLQDYDESSNYNYDDDDDIEIPENEDDD